MSEAAAHAARLFHTDAGILFTRRLEVARQLLFDAAKSERGTERK